MDILRWNVWTKTNRLDGFDSLDNFKNVLLIELLYLVEIKCIE